MTPHDREASWSLFLRQFFARPNQLAPGRGNATFDELVGRARDEWTAESAIPIFLFARVFEQDYGYVLSVRDEGGTWLQDLLVAHLGSWISFKFDPGPLESLDGAARALVGERGSVHRFAVAKGGLGLVVRGSRRLQTILKAKPPRRFQKDQPLGRLIGDFLDACASGAESTAMELLELLSLDHRLSRRNALFLRLEALATFERWDDIESWNELPNLIKMNRSTRASDALARFVMARLLPANATLDEFDQVKPTYGALIPSTAAIRSRAGAEYYAYWTLSAGENPTTVREQIQVSGWLEYVHFNTQLKELLASTTVPSESVLGPLDRNELERALSDGRLDTAITLLARAEPTVEVLPILQNVVVSTVSPDAFDILRRWRDTLGDVPAYPINVIPPSARYGTMAEAFAVAFSDAATPQERSDALTACRELAEATSMRPRAIEAFVAEIREQLPVADHYTETLVDLLLDIERDLYSIVGEELKIQPLRLLALETWALSDVSGDRRRMRRMITLLDRILSDGVSVGDYDHVVELLRAAWQPFLTDADLAMALEALELLAMAKPDSASSLKTFAVPILTRIGEHNAGRLPTMELATAVAFASEFGLELGASQQALDATVDARVQQHAPPDGTFVALYSLVEPAAVRAMQIVEARYPNVRVEVYSDKVASNSLRSAAKLADIFVVADKAAAHAATRAIVAARGGKEIDYAQGKGTMSLLSAVERGFDRIADRLAAAS